jgi:hypothetical protein
MKLSLNLDGLSLENLDEFSNRLWGAVDKLEARWADLWKEVYLAKREISSAESVVWMRWSQKLVNGKAPTQKYVDNMVEMDPQVQAAHLKYARLEHESRRIEGKLRVLRMIDRSLPGRQGERNAMFNR